MDLVDWFFKCDVYDCTDNCTGEYECIIDWQDDNYNADYTTCDDFYDTWGNDTDDEDDEDDECVDECSDPQACPDLPSDWYWCEMEYCWNSCDGVVNPDCSAEWYDENY